MDSSLTPSIASVQQLYTSCFDLELGDNYITLDSHLGPPPKSEDDEYGYKQIFQDFSIATDYLEQQGKAAEYLSISGDLDLHQQHQFPKTAP